jgi:2-dehydropantoate 2-reductase
MEIMRIAIFGVGGVGGYFGAQLARAAEDVTFIARGAHLQAIRSDGLRVETPDGEIVIQPAQATDDPAQVGVVDLVILCVKTWQVGDAAIAMRPMLGPETVVLPLQNGVEAASQLSERLGADNILSGLCGTISQVVSPGRIRSIGASNFVKFGELDGRRSDRVERLRQVFEQAGVRAETPADINAALWEKFLFVVSMGGVGAVARAPIGVTRTVPETRSMLVTCMREIRSIARAKQVTLSDDVIEKTMGFVDSLAPGGTTSMQRDIGEGRPSELEAWSGAVVRMGRETGVATPLNEFIYHSLLPSEMRARGRIEFPE